MRDRNPTINEPDVWPGWSANGWLLRCRHMVAVCMFDAPRADWQRRLGRVRGVITQKESTT